MENNGCLSAISLTVKKKVKNIYDYKVTCYHAQHLPDHTFGSSKKFIICCDVLK